MAAEQIVVGNGSTEIFYALARALSFARAIIPVPSYSDYAAAVQAAGREVCFVKLEESDDFALDWQALEAELRGEELVLLGQPNNPTGRALGSTTQLLCALAARHPTTTFVVDEAFADFVEGYTSLAGRTAANVIVVRSLTKFYAVPGLRLGYAVASAEVARQIRGQIPPWSVGVLAQEAAVDLLSDEEYARRSIALVDQQRRRLTEELTKLPGLYVYPSVTNFLLVRLDRTDMTGRRNWPIACFARASPSARSTRSNTSTTGSSAWPCARRRRTAGCARRWGRSCRQRSGASPSCDVEPRAEAGLAASRMAG